MELELIKYLPETDLEFPPLLFIHGAYHGAWCWEENFLAYFSSRGFSSYAVSFRGHGKSVINEELNTCSLSDYVEDVLKTIELLGQRPVLIGHSMGGAIVQKISYLYPDKITAAVLMSSVPPSGFVKEYWRLLLTNLRKVLAINLFNKGENVEFPADLFLSDQLPMKKRSDIISLLQPESTKALGDLCRRIVPKSINNKVPMLVLGSLSDRFFTAATAVSTCKAYNTKLVVFPEISHDMMLDPNWGAAADEIFAFLHKLTPDVRR
ncbi:alpha/beta hydrolase fold protein [Ruminiclostridium papyrosolvens DSM 2782]|uniref:Alpha/beta hydrolase fold protein n=1 Tax=Ruminiclostridium papyrosolvens DSM 2782 TaxID=588581 RepID=F1TAA2_9FIRM|nr:alpha/beta hydrolase [Ruminiclostridium papyrosolvens]EGD48844.1 alpha/beta hydrolase fold protein [Ruminiclostridium papyrosolvens DSM 2782]WES32402.1 alpha/beta hydrolase [Ruminiclostridium papyrosolvens DSM 2782]